MINTIRRLFWIMEAGSGRQMVALFAMMGMAVILETIGVSIVLPLLQLATSPEQVAKHRVLSVVFDALPGTSNDEKVLWGAVVILVFMVCKNVSIALINHFRNVIIMTKVADFRVRLLEDYISRSHSYHVSTNTSEIQRDIQYSANAVINSGLLAALGMALEVFVIIALAALLVVIDPLVTIATFSAISIFTVIYYYIVQGRLKIWGLQILDQEGKLVLWLRQALGATKESKLLGRERFFIDRFATLARSNSRLQAALETAQKSPPLFNELILLSGIVVLLAVVVGQNRSLSDALPTIGVFGVAGFRLLPSINRVTLSAVTLRKCSPAVEKLHANIIALLKERSDTPPENTTIGKLPFQRDIVLEGVDVRHEGSDRFSIDKIDMTIQCGQTVAFVGQSGAGKTTLADAILGVIDPSAGRILVDGTDIRGQKRAWQNLVGYVPQTIFLLDDTLRRNVAFGISDHDIVDEQVTRALTMAGLASLVAALPDGLDTSIGEDGARFSGGQRQRIGIARALYHDPELLVFDEATSALDTRTEQEIAEAIDNLKGRKTIIIIAHRLTTIANCDRIFLLSHGRLAEAGTFSDLAKTSEEFRRMVQAAQMHVPDVQDAAAPSGPPGLPRNRGIN